MKSKGVKVAQNAVCMGRNEKFIQIFDQKM
jgi:hypothetical protein